MKPPGPGQSLALSKTPQFSHIPEFIELMSKDGMVRQKDHGGCPCSRQSNSAVNDLLPDT